MSPKTISAAPMRRSVRRWPWSKIGPVITPTTGRRKDCTAPIQEMVEAFAAARSLSAPAPSLATTAQPDTPPQVDGALDGDVGDDDDDDDDASTIKTEEEDDAVAPSTSSPKYLNYASKKQRRSIYEQMQKNHLEMLKPVTQHNARLVSTAAVLKPFARNQDVYRAQDQQVRFARLLINKGDYRTAYVQATRKMTIVFSASENKDTLPEYMSKLDEMLIAWDEKTFTSAYVDDLHNQIENWKEANKASEDDVARLREKLRNAEGRLRESRFAELKSKEELPLLRVDRQVRAFPAWSPSAWSDGMQATPLKPPLVDCGTQTKSTSQPVIKAWVAEVHEARERRAAEAATRRKAERKRQKEDMLAKRKKERMAEDQAALEKLRQEIADRAARAKEEDDRLMLDSDEEREGPVDAGTLTQKPGTGSAAPASPRPDSARAQSRGNSSTVRTQPNTASATTASSSSWQTTNAPQSMSSVKQTAAPATSVPARPLPPIPSTPAEKAAALRRLSAAKPPSPLQRTQQSPLLRQWSTANTSNSGMLRAGVDETTTGQATPQETVVNPGQAVGMVTKRPKLPSAKGQLDDEDSSPETSTVSSTRGLGRPGTRKRKRESSRLNQLTNLLVNPPADEPMESTAATQVITLPTWDDKDPRYRQAFREPNNAPEPDAATLAEWKHSDNVIEVAHYNEKTSGPAFDLRDNYTARELIRLGWSPPEDYEMLVQWGYKADVEDAAAPTNAVNDSNQRAEAAGSTRSAVVDEVDDGAGNSDRADTPVHKRPFDIRRLQSEQRERDQWSAGILKDMWEASDEEEKMRATKRRGQIAPAPTQNFPDTEAGRRAEIDHMRRTAPAAEGVDEGYRQEDEDFFSDPTHFEDAIAVTPAANASNVDEDEQDEFL